MYCNISCLMATALYLMLLLIDKLFFGVLFDLEEDLSNLITIPPSSFPWANMARHVSIFLWLRTPPSIWILNLTRVPLFLRVLHIISRCLEQITQRNWAILMSHMATFRPYLLFIVLSMWLSIRHVMIRPHANGMTRFPRIKILLFISG